MNWVFFRQTFSYLKGKCLVQWTLIWSHTAYRRTYVIVFIYYNVSYTGHICLCFARMKTFTFKSLMSSGECSLFSMFTCSHWMFFYSTEFIMAGLYVKCVGLNYNNNTVVSPAFTLALKFYFASVCVIMCFHVRLLFLFLALQGYWSPLLYCQVLYLDSCALHHSMCFTEVFNLHCGFFFHLFLVYL